MADFQSKVREDDRVTNSGTQPLESGKLVASSTEAGEITKDITKRGLS